MKMTAPQLLYGSNPMAYVSPSAGKPIVLSEKEAGWVDDMAYGLSCNTCHGAMRMFSHRV